MDVLLIGGGGREHALAWKMAQSPSLGKLWAAPGNPGIARHAELVALDPADHDAVVAFCSAQAIDLVVIGPEAPLVAGLADRLRAEGIAVFGPSAAAARLEGSKGFTKDLCARASIPTARYVRVAALAEARAVLAGFALPVVIKADGLAAGKGVTIAATPAEAEAALTGLFDDGKEATGAEAVIEEFLEGEEVSLFVLTDGVKALSFGSAQDHKRVGEGDTGPNTGGMGAYSPATVLTPALEEAAMATIIRPTLAAMMALGSPYSGVLYAGLMLTADGPKLIEYNCRFGDPETQALMARFTGDLVATLAAVAAGRLDEASAAFASETAVTVVMAALGYPGTARRGGAIGGTEAIEETDAIVFQAGTALANGALVADGGRVLAVTATGADIGAARARAHAAIDRISFPSGFCRRDIGWREMARNPAIERTDATPQ